MTLTAGVDTTAAPTRKRRLAPMTYLYIAIGVIAVVSLIRVLTGADDLTSSGTVASALTARCRSHSQASADSGPNARASSTSGSKE